VLRRYVFLCSMIWTMATHFFRYSWKMTPCKDILGKSCMWWAFRPFQYNWLNLEIPSREDNKATTTHETWCKRNKREIVQEFTSRRSKSLTLQEKMKER
jgi:hypothetical protein